MRATRHLLRAGALLALLLIGLIAIRVESSQTFLSVRGLSYADLSRAEWSSKPVAYLDSGGCSTCHGQQYSSWASSRHASVSCETCHGPGLPHVEAKAKPEVAASGELCALCHATLPSRPKGFPQVDPSIHSGACSACHDPHSPPTVASRPPPAPKPTAPRVPHTTQGRGNCTSCHGRAVAAAFPAGHAGRTNDTCLTCHGSKNA